MRVPSFVGVSALVLFSAASTVDAARLASVTVLDKDYLVVHVLDGEVRHNEGAPETITRYTPELSTAAAAQAGSWLLKSAEDSAYGASGRSPVAVHRKKKLNGHAQMEWVGSDYRYEYTYEHWVYLRLPSPLQQGMAYTLEIAAATNSDRRSAALTFDVFNTPSEAVHVNLAGYAPDAPHKAADLYSWLGDGGARDYSSFKGRTVYVYDVANARAYPAGTVAFWKPGGPDVGWYDLTRSAVWTADFSGFNDSGTYRLVIDGVGCSQDFRIAADAYADPFKVSLRGYYYMRLGQQNPTAISPPPRTPLYLPGRSPANTTVYLTTMQPWDPRWSSFASGDPWDAPNSWAPYRKAGNPTNPEAWGGHSDAFDADRHLGHVSIIYDLLLPYILTRGAQGDDDAGITESGNGIPDVLDEARSEVDFWLRLRDGAGYSHGLTNPNSNNELFQAGPTAMAAWANAANAAMLAEAFRIAGRPDLMAGYRDAAITAYRHAGGLADPMLDAAQNIGEGSIRGRDLKMTAAAFLYNVTGDPAYEQVVNAESVCTSSVAELEDGTRNQVWASAGYLTTPQPVRFPALQANMRASVIHEAQAKEAGLVDARPSRRATDNRTGYFRTVQNVQRTMIAHAVSESQAEKDFFHKALALEADWGLGRNPLNMIEMTTATTPLAAKRSVQWMYTTGRDDGVSGLHPGHTPYLNLDDWWTGMVMGTPSRLYSGGYPADFKNSWPIGEGYFSSPWVWAHSEFTPQQTMRGKTALYAYLHGLAGGGSAPPPPPPPATAVLTVAKAGTGSGSVVSSPAGIDCGSDCSEAYAIGSVVTLQASPASGSAFAGWSGACSGSGPCALTLGAAQSVVASFEVATTSRTHGNGGSPWRIGPTGTTRIEAENFDTGGEGVAYHDKDASNNGGQYRSEGVDVEATSDAGGGFDVGWVNAGEWLEYSVDVAAPGTYDLKLRTARQPKGSSSVRVLFDGVDKTGSLAVPRTNGWQTWTDVSKTGVSLQAGRQLLRVAMVGSELNLNWIEVTAVATTPAPTPTLSVSRAGTGSGTVGSSPAGISCGADCSEPYASGTSVTLTAVAASGSSFAGWSGACAGSGACTVTMNAAQAVVATFNTAPVLPVRGTFGNGGNPWLIAAAGTTRIQAENYDTGGEGVAYHDDDASNNGGQYRSDGVDVEGAADAGGGYNVGWVDPGEWLEYTVYVEAAGTYDLKLRLARQPAGDSAISVAFGGSDKTGSLAVPSTGAWQAWTDVTKTGLSLSAGRQVMRLSLGTSPYNLNWVELARVVPPTALTVSRPGNGSGSVVSSPAGIDCGSDCSEVYAAGTTVTLTAAPATGSAFAGWGGACTGSGPCTVTMSAAQAVTATFDTATSIYGDALAADWQSWSWGSVVDFGGTSPVKAGTNAVNVTYTEGWGGLSLRRGAALGTAGYAALRFWVHGGTGADKTLGVTTHAEDTTGESARVLVTAVANAWTEVTVPLSGLGYPSAIKRVTIMSFTPEAQGTITVDELRLEAVSGPLSPLTVAKAGSGIGSVTSWPPGIQCGSDCSEGYAPDTSVTLTPAPASGSTFSGWTGACTGAGPCTVAMSDARLVTATFAGSTVAGGVRWVGRVDATNPDAVRFAWQGAGFVATVSGPTVAVRLQTTGAPSAVYQVVVDGLPGARFAVPESAIETVALASGLAAGEHVVELYRETEGMYGVSTFWGFAEGTLLGAPARDGRLVEVVGDAVSAGYGNLGSEPHPGWVANPSCTWSADNSSWYRSYGALAGRALGAEVSTVARSGWGLARDAGGNTANALPLVYGNAVGTGDATPWGFEPKASAVVVHLGMADIAAGDPGTAYEAAYVDFVRTIRGRYPDAWVFLTIGSMLGDPNLGIINGHLANVVATLNDARVVTFDLGRQDLGWDGSVPTGCDWHPSTADHARMAEILKEQLRTRLGW